jgi:spermidine/putrescine transport system permease protein
MKRGLAIERGELATRRRLLLRALLQVGGAIAWLMLFLVLPALLVAMLAFASRGDYGELVWNFSFGNVLRLCGFGPFGWSGDYLVILARSVWLAAVSSSIALLLAYPLALVIAAQTPRRRLFLLALVAIPGCTNLVIRTYGWMLLFSNQLPPAMLAQYLHLIDADAGLAPGPFAVYVGVINAILPFAILPLYPSVEHLDWSLVEAAQDCYASRWRTFRHAILPQLLPGLTAAFVLTFIPAIGMFVVPDMLGGAKYMLVGNLIQQQFGSSHDWPFGAMISLLLIVISCAGLAGLRRRVRMGMAG